MQALKQMSLIIEASHKHIVVMSSDNLYKEERPCFLWPKGIAKAVWPAMAWALITPIKKKVFLQNSAHGDLTCRFVQ